MMGNILTIEQILPYYNHELNFKVDDSDWPYVWVCHTHLGSKNIGGKIGGMSTVRWFDIKQIKPILQTLSSIIKPITHNENAEVILLSDELSDHELKMIEEFDILDVLKYPNIQKLLKHHVDIFGLIRRGIAVEYEK